MGKKLGKKARKFAKKNLQSVLKRKRKINSSIFKKKSKRRDSRADDENPEGDERIEQSSSGRDRKFEDFEDISLEEVFGEDDSDVEGYDSESDGYLSEDASFSLTGGAELERNVEDKDGDNTQPMQNTELYLELKQNMKKLDRLKEKDPEFAKFLEANKIRLTASTDEEEYSEEDDTSNDGREFLDESEAKPEIFKLLSPSAVDSLCQLVMEQDNVPAIVRLLNGYRAACHYGAESSTDIVDNGVFGKILTFMLREADKIFRRLLGISSSYEKKEAILELKNSSKWKTLKPLVKSYLRSTLHLLNEISEPEILAFTLSRLRSSTILFAAFPSLLPKLIKITVHLWATGEDTLSLQSYLVLQHLASVFNADCFDICLIKAYKAFIGHCKFVEPTLVKHIQLLKNSFVDLCSQDVPKSLSKAIDSVQQLAKILQQGLRTKKKEAIEKICSWQYTNCIDLWVAFISANIHEYDLQPLLYTIIQIINGIAILFRGPRYLPLRVKCIQWLNQLSASSGVFIPVASFTLDILEYKLGKEGSKPGKDFSFSTAVKLPKYWLKSKSFLEECVLIVIELLAVHFAQWSYHISFPELATIPLSRLRRFQEMTTIESFQRVLKRFVDQVEQNIEFVRKKRDEVAFSPKDQQSVESFLQLEKSSGHNPFTQYYKSIIEKAASRNLLVNEKISSMEQKGLKRKRRQLPSKAIDEGFTGEGHSD